MESNHITMESDDITMDDPTTVKADDITMVSDHIIMKKTFIFKMSDDTSQPDCGDIRDGQLTLIEKDNPASCDATSADANAATASQDVQEATNGVSTHHEIAMTEAAVAADLLDQTVLQRHQADLGAAEPVFRQELENFAKAGLLPVESIDATMEGLRTWYEAALEKGEEDLAKVHVEGHHEFMLAPVGSGKDVIWLRHAVGEYWPKRVGKDLE